MIERLWLPVKGAEAGALLDGATIVPSEVIVIKTVGPHRVLI